MTSLCVAVVLAFASLAVAQESATGSPPSNAAVSLGVSLFQSRCADCHGIDARGVTGPDLTTVWSAGRTDERLVQTIRNGVPGTEMPPNSLEDADIRSILAYLRTLTRDANGDPPDPATGNALHGEQIFWVDCGGCHRANGRGGRLGPDLSRVGANRSRTALERDIRAPSASILPGYQSVTLVTSDGKRVRGVRKSEDAFSIQIMDTREQLVGYLKASLQDLTVDQRSLMPDFGADRLNQADLNDLIAFLSTLRGSGELRR